MLSAIRAFSKSWVAIILFMLLLVALIVWGGMGNQFRGVVSSAVITVGSHEVSGPDFDRQFTDQLARIGQQNGGPPPSREDAIKAGFHVRMLHAMADQAAFAEAVSRLGIVPSPAQFAERLQQIPAFFNEVTGEFDKKKYEQVLAQNHIAQRAFEEGMRDEIAVDHLATGLQAGLVAPRIYGTLVAVSQLENRSFSTFVIDASKVAKPAAPTDAQLQAFINEVGQKKPETREFSFVRFSTKALEASMPVDQAELQKLYDFKKDTLSKPEMRSLVQIPVKNAGQAQQVAQRLKAGEDPAAIAKSVGATPVTYTDQPKSAITDRKVADAAFSLAAGQVSGPIQGELGLSVVKVDEIKPSLTVPFEQAKPQLEQQLKHDAAQKKVYDQVEAYEKAHEGGKNMAEAAKAVGANVETSGEIAANGATQKGQPPAGVSPKMLARVFSMAQGEDSDTEDEGNGEYYVVHVDKVTPSALPKLEDVRAEATKGYLQRETFNALKAKADEAAARIKKGESFEAVAASLGAKVEHTASLDKSQAQQAAQAQGAQVLQAVFGGAKGDVVVAAKSADAVAVVKIDDVQSGPMDQLAPLAETGRRQANGAIINDLAQSAQDYSARVLKPKIDTVRAAQTLGISPDQMEQQQPKAPAKKAKG